ncbi:hypothetical protein [Rhizobium sp. 18055]|jgi:hypothetical protein|nr:hypothetical protein [Rhizobium sp. 18055]
MAQIILNSAAAILLAAAFVTTLAAALRSQNQALQKVRVRVRNRQ